MENATCHFVFYTGSQAGHAASFSVARISAGRANNCDFHIETFSGDVVAPHHAEIIFEEGKGHTLFDLGTRSGTYINGIRVKDKASLQSEDYIRFGLEGPEVIFRTGVPVQGLQPLPQMYPDFAELQFIQGADAGKIFSINPPETTRIGRRGDLEVPLDPRGDMIVSGAHCSINYENSAFILTDTSRNGTFVNDDLVDGSTEIFDGDVITLGEHGPSARFHTDPEHKKYPNQRNKNIEPPPNLEDEEIFSSPFPEEAVKGQDSEILQELNSPHSHFTEEQSIPHPDDEISVNEEPISDDHDPLNTEFQINSESEEESYIAFTDAITPQLQEIAPESVIPVNESAIPTVPAYSPLQSFLMSKVGKVILILTVLSIITIILVLFRSKKSPSNTSSSSKQIEQVQYAQETSDTKTEIIPTGHFHLSYPAEWSIKTNEKSVSIQSPDKEIAVDYIRDASLNGEKANKIASRDGAKLISNLTENRPDNRIVSKLKSQVGKINRIVALERPAGQVPMLSFIEASHDALKNLSEKEIDKLLVGNIKLENWPLEAESTPTPSPTPEKTPEITPTPEITQVPGDSYTSGVHEPTPTPAAVTTQTPTTEAAHLGTSQSISSKSLKLKLNIPDTWSGSSEEKDEMIALKNGSGMEVRIARDPGNMDYDETFAGIEKDGWGKPIAEKTTTHGIAEFNKPNEYLMLYLQKEPAGSTLVVYITSNIPFTSDMRSELVEIIHQLQQSSK